MKKLIVASNNQHKIKEIKDMLSQFPFQVLSLKEAGIDIDIEENGTTFMENAYVKASEIFKIRPYDMILADDSGLMVDALDGAPGVYSARFAGEHGDSKKNNLKLLDMLKEVMSDERTAKFVCAMVMIIDEKTCIKVQGEIKGKITETYKGEGGFGYDPLFYIPEYKMTFAEMSSEQKNSISHRGNALKKLEEALRGEDLKCF